METKVKEDDHGRSQAKAQLESVIEMVERLKHSRDCTLNVGSVGYDPPEENCTEGSEGGDHWSNAEEYHTEDNALQVIHENALEVSVRNTDWRTPTAEPNDVDITPDEYLILLCTGGPACRITGGLDRDGQPDSAMIEYQDWGTPWTEYQTTQSQVEALLSYARCFYFGE